MKKFLGTLAVLALVASPAWAVPSDILLQNGNYSGNNFSNHPSVPGNWFSGSVTLQVIDTVAGSGVSDKVGVYGVGQTFRSFCVEFDEHISWGGQYDVSGVNAYAWKGGLAGGHPDYLSKETAWLYRSFIDGTLASATYSGTSVTGYGDNASGNFALQKAIWYLEDEWVNSSGTRVSFTVNSLEDKLVRAAQLHATQADLNFVGVVNMDPNGTDVSPTQSFLITVPAPGAALLVALGIGVVGWVRKRIA